MVATYLNERPRIPYLPQLASVLTPQEVIDKASHRTKLSTLSFPNMSETFYSNLYLLHLLAIAHGLPPSDIKIESYIIEPLYDAGYALSVEIARQKESGSSISHTEKLLTESFQLYMWIALREFPPQASLGHILVLRTIEALLPLLLDQTEDPVVIDLTLDTRADVVLQDIFEKTRRQQHHSTSTLYSTLR